MFTLGVRGNAYSKTSFDWDSALMSRVAECSPVEVRTKSWATWSEDRLRDCNGSSGKTVLTGEGALRPEVPWDRKGSFELLLIPKHERRFNAFDDKVIATYAHGLTHARDPGASFASIVPLAYMLPVLRW